MTTRPAPSDWFWLLGAPLSVVIALLAFGNLLAVFAVYHVGFCLVLPLTHALLIRRLPLRDHLRNLAIIGPRPVRAALLGLGLGVVLGGGTILAFQILGDVFLRDNNVSGMLARWGAGPEHRHLVFWFMVLINGPAEELYWRGFVHTRLFGEPGGVETEPTPPSATSLLLPSFCYASYHGVTVLMFLASPVIAILFLAVILIAGWSWAWLRVRTGSVWPALLAHTGAVAGYMIVARPLMWD